MLTNSIYGGTYAYGKPEHTLEYAHGEPAPAVAVAHARSGWRYFLAHMRAVNAQGYRAILSPTDATSESPSAPVHIIATTDAGTRAALREAQPLIQRLNVAGTVLLVPRICSLAMARGPRTDAATIERYRRMADQSGVQVTVRLCVCRTPREAFQWMLPRHAVVVVGGRRRWWWPTREQRMVSRLQRAGHVTVFAVTGA